MNVQLVGVTNSVVFHSEDESTQKAQSWILEEFYGNFSIHSTIADLLCNSNMHLPPCYQLTTGPS